MTAATLETLPVSKIKPNPHNPRKEFNAEALNGLAESLSTEGQHQPILVRKKGKGYEIIAGERRWRAVKQLEKGTGAIEGMKPGDIMALVVKADDEASVKFAVTENLQREGLSVIEESRAIETLATEFDMDNSDVGVELGKSEAWVAGRRAITKLSPKIRKKLEKLDPQWPAACIIEVAKMPRPSQDLLLGNAPWLFNSTPQLSKLKEIVAGYTRELSKAPFDIDDASLNKKAGICGNCDKRSSCRKGLFDDMPVDADDDVVKKGDRCLDPKCWAKKMRTHIERKAKDGADGKKLGGYFTEDYRTENYGLDTVGQPGRWYDDPFKKCKKSDKGAVPFFNLTRLTVQWYTKDKKSAKKSKGKKEQKTFEDRVKNTEERYYGRRAKTALGFLLDLALDTDKPDWDDNTLIEVAGRVGTRWDHRYASASDWKGKPDRARLIQGVKDTLVARLANAARLPDGNDRREELKKQAPLWGTTEAKLMKQAADEIPMPKWYQKAVEDGRIGKGKKKSKSKKGSTKKSSKKKASA